MKRMMLVILMFFILTAIMTFPLFFKINSSIPGFSSTNESYASIWVFWNIKRCWQNKISTFHCDLIAAPFGIELGKFSLNYPLWGIIDKILVIFTNEVFTFNFLVLFSFILSGVFAYYLSYWVTKDFLASLFSGIVYAFCPYHFARAWQHIGLAQIQWMPLYILALLNLRQKKTVKSAVLASLVLFLVVSFDYYYTYFMAVATAVFIVYLVIFEKRNKLATVRMVFLSAALSSLIILISAFPVFRSILFGVDSSDLAARGYTRSFDDLFQQSARPLSYFLPTAQHPIFGKLTSIFIGSPYYGKSMTEHALYLGWVPLILAFVAVREYIKNIRIKTSNSEIRTGKNFYLGFFIFLAIVAWFFSQPPWWRWGPVKILMPSFFMYKILPMFRAYCRFGIVVMLAVSVLAGFGAKLILERIKVKGIKLLIAILFCGLVLFEFLNFPPFKVIDLTRYPVVYDWLKAQPADITIAEYPLDLDGTNELYLFYQTKHHKKIINNTPQGSYANAVSRRIEYLGEARTAGILRWLGVKYVLVHEDWYKNNDNQEEKRKIEGIEKNNGLRLLGQFEDIKVYEVTAKPVKPEVKD